MAVECPTKLYYTGKNDYANQKNDNDFLKALADGGFQVGELAKWMYPNGVEVEFKGDFEKAILQTQALLKEDRVTIYEAAIRHENYFVLVDVLKKTGQQIELIEVKAKSYDPQVDTFRNRTGGMDSQMLPYLQDIAFQTWVAKQAMPHFEFSSVLMLADKSKPCSVHNLNQNFKIQKDQNQKTTITVKPGLKAQDLGEPILTPVRVDEFVDEILSTALKGPGFDGRFEDLIKEWSDRYDKDVKIPPHIQHGTHCANCEFKTSSRHPNLKSGFLECWQEATGHSIDVLEKGTVVDIYNYRSKHQLLKQRKYLFEDLERSDFSAEPSKDEITLGLRQWMQVSGDIPGGGDFDFHQHVARETMSQWSYPLHFIDFETSRTAIPFFKGQKPYSSVAFQFSHHIVHADQRLEHKGQYLETRCGIHPNYSFVRALMASVGETGTILMWTPHENTTLNSILAELMDDEFAPTDAELLKNFIRDITTEKVNPSLVREGKRCMVDLCDVAKKTFFHKMTGGSSSIKKVLPAVMHSSRFLKEKYSRPLLKRQGESLNLEEMVWWREEKGQITSPYQLLPPVFKDLDPESVATLELDPDLHISEGGSATVAYGRLQFTDVSPAERDAVHQALLQYCELDTLAMVMVYEAFLHGF
jgi:hypothetical protein